MDATDAKQMLWKQEQEQDGILDQMAAQLDTLGQSAKEINHALAESNREVGG